MATLTRASRQLFQRPEDERFSTMNELFQYCQQQREASADHWPLPSELNLQPGTGRIDLGFKDEAPKALNDWSFSQLCRMANINRDTINRLTPETACQALRETLPGGERPMQLLTTGDTVRSLHGVSYTRLWNTELLSVVKEFAVDFQAPQQGGYGGTGLYCGEQDMFAFLIDPTGWIDIGGQAFAPGFFVWNSEVGRRSLGIQTFWFQAICQNHIVWDAVEVVEFTRKHTANVQVGLNEIRRIIERLVARRDERRDGFAKVLEKAMQTKLGNDAESTVREMLKHGLPAGLAKEAVKEAGRQGRFTIFALIDALTRLTQKITYVSDRTEIDEKAAALLMLAA